MVLLAKNWTYFAAPAAPSLEAAVAAHLVANGKREDTVVLCGGTGVPVLAALAQRGFVWADRTCRSPAGDVAFGCRLLPTSLEAAPATMTRYVRALADGSLPADLQKIVMEAGAAGIWLVLGTDLRTGGSDAEKEAAGRRLFAVLHDAGYSIAGGDASLGVAYLRR
jgi:hypothetical protein